MLDVLTLHTVMALSQFTMGMFLLVLWRDNRSERALLIWASTNIFCCFSTYMFVLHGQFHPFLTVVLPAWGFLGFVVGYWMGLRYLFEWKQPWRVISAALAVQSTVVCYFALVEPLLWPRFVANALVAAFLCLLFCIDIHRAWKKTRFFAFRLFMGVFFVHGLVFAIAGSGAIITQPVGDYGTLNNNASSGFAILEGLLMFFLASICVAILIPEKLKAKLKRSSEIDALSGLFNRAHFMSQLNAALRDDDSHTSAVTVLYIDLDGFKDINDQHGHHVGDALLVTVAGILTDVTRKAGVVARMGGDEFAIFIRGETALAQAEDTASAIICALAQPLSLDGLSVLVNTSIGIAPRTAEREDALELIRRADIAMYAAKNAGRGQFAHFSLDMDDAQQETNWLKRELIKAMEEGQISVVYQPKFAVLGTQTPRFVAVEALARWHHPERGDISPNLFIPVAEQCGLIVELGRTILKDACAAAVRWPGINVSVNVSPRQFAGHGLKQDVLRIAAEANLDPSRLELEITEGVLLIADQRVKGDIKDLQAAGVKLAMDDFGTGYASFSYLRDYPFDTVKIDRSFVQAMQVDDQALEVTQAVVSLARALDLSIVAEGVETRTQFDLLKAMGCDLVQGFYLARPMPEAEIDALLAEYEAKPLLAAAG